MGSDERWLGAMWPRVASHLPPAPARVVEIGCGTAGGFVPMLRSSGYDALGIDPRAPDEDGYLRLEFEQAELSEPVDAVVACTSLHHVADSAEVVDGIRRALVPDGVVIVVEWASEAFDEPTARWCFERLDHDADGWLPRHMEQWRASDQPWDAYMLQWTGTHGIHPAERLVRVLDESFERRLLARGPYFFPDLADTTEADEQAAIDAGRIRAARLDYVGRST